MEIAAVPLFHDEQFYLLQNFVRRYCFSMSKFTLTRLLAKISTFSLRVDALRTLQVCRKQREESREGKEVGKKWSIDTDIIPLLPKHCPLTLLPCFPFFHPLSWLCLASYKLFSSPWWQETQISSTLKSLSLSLSPSIYFLVLACGFAFFIIIIRNSGFVVGWYARTYINTRLALCSQARQSWWNFNLVSLFQVKKQWRVWT